MGGTLGSIAARIREASSMVDNITVGSSTADSNMVDSNMMDSNRTRTMT
jgi:hypothetical protein